MDRKRIGSFVIGGLAGVVAGVLLAPRSGRQTRDSISYRAGEARQRSRETYFETRERLQEKASIRHDRPVDGERADSPAPKPATEPTTEQTVAPSAPSAVEGYGEEPEEEYGRLPREDYRAPETAPRPVLKDVSREEESGSPASETERSEELRRKVRETRERLRTRDPGERDKRDTRDDGGSASEE